MDQIIIWLANNAVSNITEIMTCSKPTVMDRDHANETTPMVYTDDTGQIIM